MTHLGLGLRERRRQIEALSDALATFTDVPTVVMGDFNEWRPRGLTLLRMNDAMGRAPKARSWPSRFPLFALDRIWVRPRRAIRGIWAVRTPLSRSASDHLPLCLGLDRERLRPPW